MTAHWPDIPETVLANITARWPERATTWATNVHHELQTLCAKYNATPRIVPLARYGFVVIADTPHGGIVLRASPDPDGPTQAKVAVALAELGVAPHVHEVITTDVNSWMVMDEVQPGTPLASMDPTAATLDAIAAPLAAMHNQPPPVTAMPTIYDWLRDRLNDDNPHDLPPGKQPAPREVRRNALDMLNDLAQDTEPALCHGDASTWNVLANGNRWLLIDPRGLSGEVDYDAAVLATKYDRTNTPLTARRLAGVIGADPARVLAWVTISDASRVWALVSESERPTSRIRGEPLCRRSKWENFPYVFKAARQAGRSRLAPPTRARGSCGPPETSGRSGGQTDGLPSHIRAPLHPRS